MPSAVSAALAPFGGVVSFTVAGYSTATGTTMTIARSSNGISGSYINIYSGNPLALFIDVGDGLPTSLLSGSTYYWNFSDPSGTVSVGPITPTGNLQYSDDNLTAIILRCLQAGIDNQVLPNGIKRATVMQDMPLNGFPELPLITLTAKLEEQENIGIGQQIPEPIQIQNQIWTQACLSRKLWQVSVLCSDTQTRDYYKRLSVLIFQTMLPNVLQSLGQNVSHKYMINVGQTVEDLKQKIPGFYFADVMLELTGNFTTNVQLSYPKVTGALIGITATGSGISVATSGNSITVSAFASGYASGASGNINQFYG